MGLLLLSNGAEPSQFSDEDWSDAMDKLRKARRDGQIRAFTGNEYIQDLTAGNILACVAWSGDVIAAGDPNLRFVAPEEGLMIWSDNMLVPNLAQHQANAERWIDHYYDPAVAAKLASWVNYICPVQGAQAEMERIDPELAESELIFPTEETLSLTHSFMALKEYQTRAYEGEFADVTGG
jgi:spermidine/putrescine transport system substrate-binding protein